MVMNYVTACKEISFLLFLLRLYSTSAEGLWTPGPTACLKLLQKVCLKSWRKEKNP